MISQFLKGQGLLRPGLSVRLCPGNFWWFPRPKTLWNDI